MCHVSFYVLRDQDVDTRGGICNIHLRDVIKKIWDVILWRFKKSATGIYEIRFSVLVFSLFASVGCGSSDDDNTVSIRCSCPALMTWPTNRLGPDPGHLRMNACRNQAKS